MISWSIIALFLLGGIIPLLAAVLRVKSGGFTRLSLFLGLAGSIAVALCALKVLIEGNTIVITLGVTEMHIDSLPTLELTLYIDRLAAFFLLLMGGLSAGISLYSFTYLREKKDQAQIAGAYNFFVLAGVLFVAANNTYFFIVLLECTTLAFGALVLHKHYEDPASAQHQRAIKTYLIANHIGGAFVLTAFLILALSYHPVTFDMSVYRHMNKTAYHGANNVIFLLALIGFGIKAGIMPFHIWVPISHPSSPTNTHAMSLGIMIKIALYGMIRVFLQFLYPIPQWWGFTVLLIAAFTALVGVRNALYGYTLKDSLADHSVENIGIILAGIGLALFFSSYPQTSALHSLTGLALVAGLYHLLNHTVFKGLLYLCTGAIDYLTKGVVELKRLGGLIHRYPWTSACFLVGSVAIAGFPPFNGFISEWLTLQTLIAGANMLTNDWLQLMGIVLSTVLLTSAFALTAFAFVKIAGEALLGKPRDKELHTTFARGDVPWLMRGILVVLAALCLVLGIVPGFVISTLGLITGDIGFPLAFPGTFSLWGEIPINLVQQKQHYTVHLQTIILFTLLGMVFLIFLIALRTKWQRRARAVWTGGTRYDPGSMQYTSSIFTSPVRDFLGKTLMRVRFTLFTQGLVISPSTRVSTQEFTTFTSEEQENISTSFEVSKGRSVKEPFREAYNWLIRQLQLSARFSSRFVQNGDLRSYLLYIFVFAIAVFFVFIFLTGVTR
jgi:hydrogenase-4 component B